MKRAPRISTNNHDRVRILAGTQSITIEYPGVGEHPHRVLQEYLRDGVYGVRSAYRDARVTLEGAS